MTWINDGYQRHIIASGGNNVWNPEIDIWVIGSLGIISANYLFLSEGLFSDFVVDLGRDPSSPVPGYRLGSRESVRLGRFH